MVYLYMQTFAIPGTLSLSILAGAIYGSYKGLLLVTGEPMAVLKIKVFALLTEIQRAPSSSLAGCTICKVMIRTPQQRVSDSFGPESYLWH